MRDRCWILVCVLVLFGVLFYSVLFRGHQFIYRDAGHFYYPYFQFIQQQWQADRVPLWNPHENSGSPLLANPTSSVLYPGKLLFFLPIQYAAAYRWYIMLHVLLCVATAYWMGRHFGGSALGAGVCGLSYAFSGPVLLQHANIVFLVGAAWAPAAVVFADRALRRGKTSGAVGLGVVLALQVLGGDPEIAYLCGVLAAVYAAGLFLSECRRHRAEKGPRDNDAHNTETHSAGQARFRRFPLLALAAGTAVVLSLVQILPTWQFKRHSSRAFSQLPRTLYAVPGAWIGTRTIPAGFSWYDGLLGAGPPVPHNIYDFSTEPWRWLEMLWPNVTGRTTSLNTRWDLAVPGNQPIWTPTLYSGLVPLILAVGAIRWRNTSAPRRWLAVMVFFGLVGSLGTFGLVWLCRLFLGGGFFTWQAGAGLRSAGDEVGGLYWLLTVLLPSFVEFRYPSKLLVFSALGISGLAATAWDNAMTGNCKRVERIFLLLAVLSAVFLVLSLAGGNRIEQHLNAVAEEARDPYDGPLDVPATKRCIQGAFFHTTLVGFFGVLLLALRRRRPQLSLIPGALLALVAVDLALANHWLIATGPQSLFETEPHALGVIREAEKTAGDVGEPFRIFRPALFQPLAWSRVASETRAYDGIRWERDSLAPKYGLPYGLGDVSVLGTMALYDYEYFFAPWTEPVDPARRRANPKLPERVVRYAERSFDFWNVKYFVLPLFVVLTDEYRGVGSILADPEDPSRRVPALFEPPSGKKAEIDYQIVLNPDAFPRAWIVHRVTTVPPILGFEKADRDGMMRRLMLDESFDLRQEALVETDEAGELAELAELEMPASNDTLETCEFTGREADGVSLQVRAATAGLLVLAETFYPGWEATLDGEPTAILRTNRMMRGVLVPAGEHRVTFTYNPALIYYSASASAVGWGLLMLLLGFVLVRTRVAGVGPTHGNRRIRPGTHGSLGG